MITAFFSFVEQSLVKILFHGIFVATTMYPLYISVPPYICKKIGHGGTCACDVYEHHDFYPMIGLGIIGTLLLSLYELDATESLFIFIPIMLLSVVIFFFIPKKEIQPLKYPKELRIDTIDEFQQFIMTNPNERKLITILKPTCDFCTMQVDELNQIPYDMLSGRLRILDLAFEDELDPLLIMTLNITDFSKLPVPSTRVYDSGMEIELKEGILTYPEIQDLLI
jgi:hypothetical protein